jgi:sulfide:quinone oxidoreductase
VELVESRGIRVKALHKILRVEAQAKRLHFEGGLEAAYDLLLAVPPHRPPAVVREAGLTDASGWVPVDPRTLASSAPGVYAVGDVNGLKLPAGGMLPKAGIMAELEGEIVADRILASLGQSLKPKDFDGKGYCFFEAGEGRAMKVQGDFFGPTTDRVRMEAPSEEGFQAKQAFEAERLKSWFG